MPTRLLTLSCVLFLALAGLTGCSWSRSSTDGGSSRTSDLDPEAVSRAQALTTEGQHLKTEGYTAQALNRFTQAIEFNPRLTEAYLGIGDIYRERGIYQEASVAYRRAIVSDPNNFDARYYLGLTNQLQGRLPQAIASYERALRIQPDSFLANRDMGSAYLQSGRAADAIAYAERAVELDPENQAAWANLAAAYSVVGEYEKAVEAYRQTLELGDAVTQVMIGLADAHINLGNYQRAENVLRAIERQGGDPLATERMGLVLFRQRKFEQAVESYRGVLEVNPDDTAALNGLGVSLMAIYLRDGESDDQMRMDALNLWRRSLALRPEQGQLIDLISRYTEE